LQKRESHARRPICNRHHAGHASAHEFTTCIDSMSRSSIGIDSASENHRARSHLRQVCGRPPSNRSCYECRALSNRDQGGTTNRHAAPAARRSRRKREFLRHDPHPLLVPARLMWSMIRQSRPTFGPTDQSSPLMVLIVNHLSGQSDRGPSPNVSELRRKIESRSSESLANALTSVS